MGKWLPSIKALLCHFAQPKCLGMRQILIGLIYFFEGKTNIYICSENNASESFIETQCLI